METASIAAVGGEIKQKPNILLIVSDQLARKAIGGYGNMDVKSPNIDSIINNGVRFDKAYTICPLCLPARAAMWTGRYPHETRAVSNYPHETDVPENLPTLGETFSNAGYDTVHFGKQHDAGTLRGFYAPEPVKRDIKSEWPVNYDSQQDVDTTAQAIDYLKNPPRDKPFLLAVDLNNPHNICGYIGENKGAHDRLAPHVDKLPELPHNFNDADFDTRSKAVQYICCSHPRLEQASSWTDMNYRHYLAAYYQYISMVDKNIGKVLKALNSTEAGKNTIIIFMADHGEGMAAHRLVTKQISFYEESTNIPFVISGKNLEKPDSENKDLLVTSLDLFPTLCDLAEITPPAGLQGKSLIPYINGQKTAKEDDYIVSEWFSEYMFTVSPGRMIRSKRYKYINYLEGNSEELYDIEKDPGETRNLAPLAEHKEILDTHRGILKKHVKKTKDSYFSLPVLVDKRYRSHAPGYPNHTGSNAITEGREENTGRERKNYQTLMPKIP